MSIRQGNKVIAGHINYHPDLLDHKWADHILNDVSWLRADTFSWQDGGVYQAAYQHLVEDYNNGPLESETINGQLIYFHRAPDGHKVVMVYDDETHHKAVETIYNATGVAWYYIIDTTNQRFKLPRAKHNKYAASLNVFGNGKPLVMTDGTDTLYLMRNYMGVNEYRNTVQITTNSLIIGESKSISQAHVQKGIGVSTDSSKSGMQVVQAQDTDQYKYLYFYVGNFTQTALENTAGVVTEDFNELNAHKVIAFQAPNAGNNYTWYRKYADGWVEQGGRTGAVNGVDATARVNLLIAMSDANYAAYVTISRDTTGGYRDQFLVAYNRNTTFFWVYSNWAGSGNASQNNYAQWLVCGIAA